MKTKPTKDDVRNALYASGALEEIYKLGKDHLRNAVIELMVERQIMRMELDTFQNPQIILTH
jgi:hypothetical protein